MEIDIRSPRTENEWNDYYDLRYRILRKPLGQPLGSEKNGGDETGEHFALYENNILKAIARLDKFKEGIAQVRFVAVEKETQKKGFGKKIMLAVEEKAKNDENGYMILHARDYAIEFYLKLDYQLVEKSYKLFDILQHYLMEKKLI